MNLDSLYQEVILNHAKHPHNYRELEDHDAHAHRLNPTCGDTIDVYLTLDADKRIIAVTFQGAGCAISQASASIMTDIMRGKTAEQAQSILHELQSKMTDREGDFVFEDESLGDLEALGGVRQFPTRVRCAMLAWHTLEDALSTAG